MKLDLTDLKPTEATFVLSKFPEKPMTLKPFSLNAQIWVTERFGVPAIEGIFKDQRIGDISEIVFFLLKDKSPTPTLESFRESILTKQDKLAMMNALLETIGISQPVMAELTKAASSGNAESLNQLIGASTTTSSPPNTATP